MKNYAKAVRLVLERERSNGADFESAWRRALTECPAPADWTMEGSEGTNALDYLRRIFSLAYHGHGPETALSDDLLPLTKDATPKPERVGCRSRKCPNDPLAGDRFCGEHRAILDRVRDELAGESVSRHRIVDVAA